MCLNFSAEICTILQALLFWGALSKLPLLFPFPLRQCSVLLRFPLHHFFYLTLSGRNYLLFPPPPPPLSGYNGSTHFFQGITWPMSWPGVVCCSDHPPCHVVSLLSPMYFSFLGLEPYQLIKIFRHTGRFSIHCGICAFSSCLLCPLSSLLQWTLPSVKFLSF